MGKLQPASYYDTAFLTREEYSKPASESWYVPLWELALFHLEKFRKDISILDMGSGTGQFGKWITDKGFSNYQGFDFSSVGVSMGNKLLPGKFFHWDIYNPLNYAFPVDVYTCFEVLEHLEDDIKVLKLLPCGANFIFSVPQSDDPSHVRVFEAKEKIIERYSPYLVIEDISEYGYRFMVKSRKK